MRYLVVLFITIILTFRLCIGQETEWAFDVFDISSINAPFTKQDMLITGSVQDKNGFIWLITHEGFLGYDGQSIFPFAEELTSQILPYTSYYSQIKIDSFQNFWIFNRENGTIRINKEGTKMERFERPEILVKNNAWFSDGVFISDSILWLSSNDFGIHKYHLQNKSWHHFYPNQKIGTVPEYSCGYLIENPYAKDEFYISSRYGICKFNWKFEKFTTILFEEPLLEHRVRYLYPLVGFQKEILMGCPQQNGIKRIDPNHFKWKASLSLDQYAYIYNTVLSFLPYGDSSLILGGYTNQEMLFINVQKNKFVLDQIKGSNPDSSTIFHQQLYPVKDGSVIIIGQDDITRMRPKKNNFPFYRLTPTWSDKNNWQRSFLQLADPDKFLIGSYFGDGLFEVDWKKKKHKIIPFQSGDGYYNYDASMWTIVKIPDENDQYLIGGDHGILKADLKQEKILKAVEFENHPILKGAEVRYLFYHNSYLWISTLQNGIFRYNQNDQKIQHIIQSPGIVVAKILSVKEELLFATNLGLSFWSLPQDTLIQMPVNDIHSKNITDICLDDTLLWIATEDSGIWSMPMFKGDIKIATPHINPETVMLNFLDKIVLVPERDEIWMNSRGGFSVFNKKDKKFINYLIQDGIGFSKRNGGIFSRAYDGAIITGANRYFQYFYPDSLSKKVVFPTPYLKQIAINGHTTKTNEVDHESLFINAGTDNIAFKMGAVNYNTHPINYFSYRLDGIQSEWSDWSYNNYVNFSNLNGGDYVFKYRAANKLLESNIIKSVPFTIKKKLVETTVFKLFTGLMIIGLFFAGIKYWQSQQQREIKLREEYQAQINELQMNALQLQMNPHFVFNSINSINYYIIKNDKDKASNYLAKFSRLIRIILENSKEKLISLEQELEAIKLYLELEQVRFEDKFHFEIDISPEVHLSSTQIPPLILQPYVENAIWHGFMNKEGVGHLLIQIKNVGKYVQCIIEDDGIGRDAAQKLNKGKRLKKQSLGTRITSDRLEHVKKIYGIDTDVQIIDLRHMDGSPAGTRVVIISPQLKPADL